MHSSNLNVISPLAEKLFNSYSEYCILSIQDGNLDACSVANIPRGILGTRVNPRRIRIRVEGQIGFEYGNVWTWKFLNPDTSG